MDKTFVKRCLQANGIEGLKVTVTKRSGFQTPRQLKVCLKAKKSNERSAARQKMVAECLNNLKRCPTLKKYNIQVLDIKEAENIEKSVSTPLSKVT